MKMLLETNIEIGQELYFVWYRECLFYPTCNVCHGKRTIEIEKDGVVFRGTCINCIDNSEKLNKITMKDYYISHIVVKRIYCRDDRGFFIEPWGINIKTLVSDCDPHFQKCNIQYYTNFKDPELQKEFSKLQYLEFQRINELSKTL